jgi:hypothetical protein
MNYPETIESIRDPYDRDTLLMDAIISGGGRVAASGAIAPYPIDVQIQYYEEEDGIEVIKYRTLPVHPDLMPTI